MKSLIIKKLKRNYLPKNTEMNDAHGDIMKKNM